ncbi:MAG: response regulator [Firmicutes bacterium]|nr:response regulator [Bacillota bacterium]
MPVLRALVADDEQPARDELKYLLSSLGTVEVVGEASNGTEAVALARRLVPDVLFLDVAMPGMSGLDVARELRCQGGACPRIVFATAYDEYAVQAFEVCAVDYLLKPFDRARLAATVGNLKKALSSSDLVQERLGVLLDEMLPHLSSVKIPVERNGSIALLDAGELVYAQCMGDRVRLKTFDKECCTKLTLSQLENRLNRRFLRVHRTFLVNLDKVAEVIPWFSGTYTLAMKDKEHSKVPVARTHVRHMKEALGL